LLKIEQVVNKKQIKDFIEFPINLYKNNEHFVPPLYSDEKDLFSNKNMYKSTCDDIFFLVYDDNKVVGRIQGIIQKVYNEIHNTKICRFTRFDSIDDINVSNLLFDTLKDWAKEKGMTELVGPLGYSDLEREGLLIDGFDERQTFEEQYNYPYYQKLIEEYGFTKDVDWIESEIKVDYEKAKDLKRISDIVYKRYKFKNCDPKKFESNSHYINRIKDKFFYLLDEGYKEIYGTVPFNEEMKKQVIKEFKLFIDPKYVKIIVDENENPVAFAIAFPHISDILVGTNGKLTIPMIIKLIKRIKKPYAIDLGLVAVHPDYLKKGAVAPIMYRITESFEKNQIKFMETNLNLEENYDIRDLWKRFDTRDHKRRRSFIKSI